MLGNQFTERSWARNTDRQDNQTKPEVEFCKSHGGVSAAVDKTDVLCSVLIRIRLLHLTSFAGCAFGWRYLTRCFRLFDCCFDRRKGCCLLENKSVSERGGDSFCGEHMGEPGAFGIVDDRRLSGTSTAGHSSVKP